MSDYLSVSNSRHDSCSRACEEDELSYVAFYEFHPEGRTLRVICCLTSRRAFYITLLWHSLYKEIGDGMITFYLCPQSGVAPYWSIRQVHGAYPASLIARQRQCPVVRSTAFLPDGPLTYKSFRRPSGPSGSGNLIRVINCLHHPRGGALPSHQPQTQIAFSRPIENWSAKDCEQPPRH
jgi:hypothetical protein